MIITIDVDLTIVPSDKVWLEYLHENCLTFDEEQYQKDQRTCSVKYNLSEYFTFKRDFDPFSFWRNEDLYDDIVPYKAAVEVINTLCKDHQVVFVSALKGNHHKSKVEMCKAYFPNLSGFVGTKEKNFVKSDLHIDDRHIHLNQMDGECTAKIKYNTIYQQEEELKGVVYCVDNWYDIDFYINELFRRINEDT